jgi:ribosomal protein S12 methylthiotransferase
VIRERDNICKYLDMPLQHATTSMLQAMRRGITREKTDALIEIIREKVPGIALRTTLITGFPGETKSDFEEMMSWVEKTRFDRLGVFTYSHEENTFAHSLKDDVPAKVKQQRADDVMELQAGISEELNQLKVGKKFKVLVDRKEGDQFIGRTEYDSPEVDNEVIIDASANEGYVRIGDFVEVEMVSAEHYDLYARVL